LLPTPPPPKQLCWKIRDQQAFRLCSWSVNPAQTWLNGIVLNWTGRSSALGRDIAGGDLVFVGGKGCQDFGLLALRDFGEIKGASEFRCNLIEFCWRDPEAAVGFLKTERRCAGFGGRELERCARTIANPKRPHKFKAG
jgi:hypothetical protein